MTTQPLTAADLFRAVELRPDGPAVLGRPIRAPGARGVYVVELTAPLATAPIELTRIGKWIENVPTLRLDGERPTSKALAARLASFWLPATTILYVGSSDASIAGRIAALERHVLGDRRPHAASHWLKTLRVDGLRVWWAGTEAAEEYEDALLSAFAEAMGEADRAGLPDTSVVLPFANLRTPTGQAKRHGVVGSIPPAEVIPPAPPTRVVELPPGTADGVDLEPKGTGTTRRAPAAPPVRRSSRVVVKPTAGAAAAPARPANGPGSRRGTEAIELSAAGLERLQTEHAELLGRRPGVVARIRAAKELGDLKENSDYTAAREEQSFLEGRIQAVEDQLRRAVVVDAPSDGSRVVLGSRVRVENDGEEQVFTIVGTTESDASAGRISQASPVGKALLGRSAGDDAVVRTPGGEIRYRVLAIE